MLKSYLFVAWSGRYELDDVFTAQYDEDNSARKYWTSPPFWRCKVTEVSTVRTAVISDGFSTRDDVTDHKMEKFKESQRRNMRSRISLELSCCKQ